MEQVGEKMGQAIEAMLPSITEQVAAQLRERALRNLEHQVTQAVGEEVKRYLTENIIPSVTAELKAADPEIRAAIVAGIKAASVQLAAQIEKRITDKITGYEGDKVVAAILRQVSPGPGY